MGRVGVLVKGEGEGEDRDRIVVDSSCTATLHVLCVWCVEGVIAHEPSSPQCGGLFCAFWGLLLVLLLWSVCGLQEIIRDTAGGAGFSTTCCGVKGQEGILEVLINLHNCGLVPTSVTIVGGGEDGDDILLMDPGVTIDDQLMRSRNQCEAVVVVELLRDVDTEGVTRTTGGDTPGETIIRVRPEQITHCAFMGDLLQAVQGVDTVQRIDGGRETTVEAENLLFNECSEGDHVEEVSEKLPHVCSPVLAQAFIIKPVHLGDLAGLVVTTGDGDAVGVADLESKEEGDGLNTVVTTIDVITHEQVVGLWGATTHAEQFNQIMELTVD